MMLLAAVGLEVTGYTSQSGSQPTLTTTGSRARGLQSGGFYSGGLLHSLLAGELGRAGELVLIGLENR
jgi:hypothetical protein